MLPRQTTFTAITLVAAAILMITMGVRQSMGLFVSPLNTSTGLGIASISFALAIAQFVWGLIQPIAGAIADKYGPGRVLAAGIIMLALGSALTPYMTSTWGIIFSLGLLSAIGSGSSSFSVLIGATAQRLQPEKRGMAAGIINAGGSFGQFIFAPVLQRLISGIGWMGTMWAMAIITLAALPFTRMLRRQPSVTAEEHATLHSTASATPAAPEQTLRAALREAMANPSYLLLHAGFFTCGFHLAFLVTHLPGEVQLCGLPVEVASWSLSIIGLANIVGSLAAGWGVSHFRSKYILFWMYASRSALVIIYLLSPKTDVTFYLFAAGLGLTWLATVAPNGQVRAVASMKLQRLAGGRLRAAGKSESDDAQHTLLAADIKRFLDRPAEVARMLPAAGALTAGSASVTCVVTCPTSICVMVPTN